MDTWVWILIALVALVVVAGIVWSVVSSRRRARLQEGFGPEYDRVVEDAPSRRQAESELRERQARRDEFDIRPLPEASRERYARSWEAAQARFVDDPEGAVRDADALIQSVMRERGYPVDDFDQRAADLSVDHPDVVEHYREGHELARRSAVGDGDVTEARRQAMVHYRRLFEELLVAEPGERVETSR